MKQVTKVYAWLIVLSMVIDMVFAGMFMSVSHLPDVINEGIQTVVAQVVTLLIAFGMLRLYRTVHSWFPRVVLSIASVLVVDYLLYFIHSYGITVMDNWYHISLSSMLQTIYLTNGVFMLLLILFGFVVIGCEIITQLLPMNASKKNITLN